MKCLGVEFAPLNVPLNRRLQTLGVLYYTFLFAFQAVTFTVLLVFVALCTDYHYVAVAVFLWVWLDRKTPARGGRRFEWMRRVPLWRWMRDYFPIRLIKTSDLDPNRNYICAVHPHGIIAAGAGACFASEALNFSGLYPGITPYILTLKVQFKMPIHRDIMMGLGSCAVSKSSIDWILTNEGTGNLVCIVVGGAKEALDAHAGSVRLTLKDRKGFVRRALINGASLVPTFTFGENEIYKQLPNPKGSLLRKFQDFVEMIFGVSPPFVNGRGIYQYTFGLLPHRVPIDVVVGKSIDVEKHDNVTEADVDRIHKRYLDELKAMYDEHRVNYPLYKDVEMEFV